VRADGSSRRKLHRRLEGPADGHLQKHPARTARLNPAMPKKKLIEIIRELLKAEMEMHFLDQLHEDDLQALADSIRERIDGLKRRKRDGDP
jgi:hypothetical protein